MTVTDLHVLLSYRDAAAAIDWLERALGFGTTMRYDTEDGVVGHAELRRDAAVIVVFDDAGAGYDHPRPRGEGCGTGTYLTVAEAAGVDALWTSALAAGAVPVWEPGWTPWGNYRCRVLDPEGREWTAGIHRPGEEYAG
ncbi:VOC family protein [Pseudonocardia nematodicida]|uniref:VOC family protein n=1 Tax=Pseudonocardia nematodicida TaxID=1206997 RepID=A0ABV1K6V9_9PSEU